MNNFEYISSGFKFKIAKCQRELSYIDGFTSFFCPTWITDYTQPISKEIKNSLSLIAFQNILSFSSFEE